MLSLAMLSGCKQDAVELRSAVDFGWEFELCGARGAAKQAFVDEDSAASSVRHVLRFECDVRSVEGSFVTSVAVLRGDRDPGTSWCSVELGPAYLHGPVSPDAAVSFVADPIFAALFRSAFVGVDPRREYDLETNRRECILRRANMLRNAGVELTLGVDGCQPSYAAETRNVGAPISFTPR